uniref:Uncharacterized protein n=1 Tax=Arundo donax TaxID=35708 RepID=A0A0A9H3S9_ARUDO
MWKLMYYRWASYQEPYFWYVGNSNNKFRLATDQELLTL